MRLVRVTLLVSLLAILVLGLAIDPVGFVRAQTGAAVIQPETDPDILREMAGGIHRITGRIPADGGAIIFSHPNNAIETYLFINGKFAQIAWFDSSMVSQSGASALSVTDPVTGFKTTFSPSHKGGNFRNVEIFNAAGSLISHFDFQVP